MPDSASAYLQACQAIYRGLCQDQTWYDTDGSAHPLDLMSVEYKRRVLRFVRKNGQRFRTMYETGELAAVTTPVGAPAQSERTGVQPVTVDQLVARQLARKQRLRPDVINDWLREASPLVARLERDVELKVGGDDHGPR